MENFLEAYRQLIGRELEGIAFLPMAYADTPGVVADLNKPTFCFSGAVSLGFVDTPELLLTWIQVGDECVLGLPPNPLWTRFALDRITMSPEEPWERLSGANLTQVETFTNKTVTESKIVAVRHVFEKRGTPVSFWVASGFEMKVGEGDDLVVAIDDSLPDSGLQLVKSL